MSLSDVALKKDKKLFERFVDLATRDITVLLICGKEWMVNMKKKNYKELCRWHDMQEKFSNLRIYSYPKLHAKLVVASSKDKDDRGTILTSANFTKTGLTETKEIGIFFDGREHDEVHQKLFEFTETIAGSDKKESIYYYI